ncbi:MAG TPA: ferredoxin reductase, partial [Nevskiaceae bacterium]|nr:ferredoxin reductase [Nevskiaceae bacterium]
MDRTVAERAGSVRNGAATWRSRIESVTDWFAFPLRTSHYVELVNPLWASHDLQARVIEVWDETRDARTLTLKPGINWRGHRAGQHMRVGVAVGGMNYTRTYTISSPPGRDDDLVTITVKALTGGRVSHHLVRQTKVGDYLPIGLPQGDFYIPDAQPVRPLFITAGSGVTPARSMVRALIHQGRLPDTVHVHYAPHEFDVIFGRELRELAAKHPRYRFVEVHTRAAGDAEDVRRSEHFSPAQLERLCPDWATREVYACGPPGLLSALERHFTQAGRARNFHLERFRADFSDVPADAVGGEVRFARSGLTAQADKATTLLRVAEDAGMNPPHGCRMGICHTCNTRLLSGAVRDLRTGKLINEVGGIVQTCICAA